MMKKRRCLHITATVKSPRFPVQKEKCIGDPSPVRTHTTVYTQKKQDQYHYDNQRNRKRKDNKKRG